MTKEFECLPGSQLIGTVKGTSSVQVINVDEFSPNKEASLGARGIVDDLMRRDHNFKYPRQFWVRQRIRRLMILCEPMKREHYWLHSY